MQRKKGIFSEEAFVKLVNKTHGLQMKPWVHSPLGAATYATAGAGKATGSEVDEYPQLHSKFKNSLAYIQEVMFQKICIYKYLHYKVTYLYK